MTKKDAIATREKGGKVEVMGATSESAQFLEMIMNAARDPAVDPEKLGKLLDFKERVLAKDAETQWNQAMSDCQEEMRRIKANKLNPQTHSRYADHAAIDRVLRPIYTKHGFALTYNTGQGTNPISVPNECVRVWVCVAHRAGHKEWMHVDMPYPSKGARGGDVMTNTHAVGAAMQYGMRYLLKFAFNVAIGEDDTDGNAPEEGDDEGKREDKSPNRAPQSKSASRAAKDLRTNSSAKATNPLGLKRAPTVDDKLSPSTVKTMESQMKHAKIPDGEFRRVFGFPLEDANRADLNQILGWIKEQM